MNRPLAAWRFVTAALFSEGDLDSRLRAAPTVPLDLWPEVVRLADANWVTPALWTRLREASCRPALPPEASQYLHALYDMNVERNRRIRAQLDEVLEVLNRRSIVPLLLKGAAYMQLETHGDPGARILADLDLLFEPNKVKEARAALKEIDYQPLAGATPRFHHDVPMTRRGDLASIELHWSVLGRRAKDLFNGDEFWRRARRVVSGALFCYVPSPADAVLHTFAHSQIVDRRAETFRIGLRPLQDLAALSAFYVDEIDWDEVTATARSRGYDREWKDFLYIAFRVAGVRSGERIRFGVREKAYYSSCLAAIRWAWMDSILSFLARFSRRDMQEIYGGEPGLTSTNVKRLRYLSDKIRGRLVC